MVTRDRVTLDVQYQNDVNNESKMSVKIRYVLRTVVHLPVPLSLSRMSVGANCWKAGGMCSLRPLMS